MISKQCFCSTLVLFGPVFQENPELISGQSKCYVLKSQLSVHYNLQSFNNIRILLPLRCEVFTAISKDFQMIALSQPLFPPFPKSIAAAAASLTHNCLILL